MYPGQQSRPPPPGFVQPGYPPQAFPGHRPPPVMVQQPPPYGGYPRHPPYGGSNRFPPPPLILPPQGGYTTYQKDESEQPTLGLNWMSMPPSVPNCPAGLEYLSQIDHLLVEQTIDFLEVFTGWEMANRYKIWNNQGQCVYLAIEDSEEFMRQSFGATRPFDMKIVDNYNQEVMHFYRPYKCDCCCCPGLFSQQVMEVTAPVGEVIGYVAQEWNCCVPLFRIEDEHHHVALKIKGPCITMACCGDVPFQVLPADGRQHPVGEIRKHWMGYVQEAYTNADNFGITFPMDASVKTKAVMLAACFLIDFMYFENNANNQNRRSHHHY